MKFKKHKLIGFICLILLGNSSLSSQALLVHGFAETGILAGTNGRIPFWLLSNQYGRFSPESGNGYIDAGIFSDSLDKNKTLAYDWGLEGFGRFDGKLAGWPQQAWLGGKWKFLYAFVGLKEEHFGSQDNQMSSGMVMWSGNARPLPKVSLATLDYVNVPFTKGFVQFQGGISHGWFGNNGYVKQAYLHHKYFYLRFGGESRFHLSLGLQHFATWGGISPNFGKLPSNLASFIKVFFASGGKDSISGIPSDEWKNRFGDHRGTKDISIDYKFNNEWFIQAYWQNFIEDIMGSGFRQAVDGLWGITIKDGNYFRFCFEYLHTSLDNSPFVNGRYQGYFKDYFNNATYLSGWTYKEYVIGSPMISSPVLYTDKSLYPYLINNRVIGYIASCSISNTPMSLFLRYSFTKNFGAAIWNIDPPAIQSSFLLTVTKRNFIFQKIDASLSTAMDIGNLYGNHFGFEYKMRWNF